MPEVEKPTRREQERRRRQSDNGTIDLDERSRKRTEVRIIVGGQTFYRRKKNNEVSLRARDLGKEQDRAIRRGNHARSKLDDVDPDNLAEVEGLEDEVFAAEDQALDLSFELAAILLRDGEGNPPSIELLKAELDLEDLRVLTRVGGGEPLEGPTETPTSSGS
jgi:hypothetical protein